jgi:hypothetical protein
MVFLLAALIALSLYSVMPRVAFEAQRDQEQMLIDRGGQYKRAIQLYYHKFRKYPAKMEDLENTNSQRFLRQRYNDPLTGKNEWRLIHVGPSGQLTDSLTQQKSTTPAKDSGSVNNFITELKPMGDNSTPTDTQVPIGMRRRPSDPGGAGNVDPNNPPVAVPMSGDTSGGSGNPGGYEMGGAMAPSGGNYPGSSGMQPGGTQPVGTPDAQGYIPGGEMNPNAPGNAVVAGSMPNPNGALPTDPTAVGSPVSSNSPGTLPPTSPNDVIRNLLTSPRPGGPPPGIFNPSGRPMTDVGFADGDGSSIPPPTTSTPVGAGSFSSGSPFGGQAQGSAFGGQTGSTMGGMAGTPVSSQASGSGGFVVGSFAGVASTVKRPSIKIYNDHQKYNEWEFIYDYAKEAAAAAGLPQGASQQNPLAPGQQGSQPNSSNPSNSSSPFGGNSSSPFGGGNSSSPFGGGNPPSAGAAAATPPSQ